MHLKLDIFALGIIISTVIIFVKINDRNKFIIKNVEHIKLIPCYKYIKKHLQNIAAWYTRCIVIAITSILRPTKSSSVTIS